MDNNYYENEIVRLSIENKLLTEILKKNNEIINDMMAYISVLIDSNKKLETKDWHFI